MREYFNRVFEALSKAAYSVSLRGPEAEVDARWRRGGDTHRPGTVGAEHRPGGDQHHFSDGLVLREYISYECLNSARIKALLCKGKKQIVVLCAIMSGPFASKIANDELSTPHAYTRPTILHTAPFPYYQVTQIWQL